MNLKELAAKPKLVKITLDAEELITKYGDEIEFYIYDRLPIDQYIKIATSTQDNFGDIVHWVNTIILNDQGEPCIKEGETLPADVMLATVNAVVERLGK